MVHGRGSLLLVGVAFLTACDGMVGTFLGTTDGGTDGGSGGGSASVGGGQGGGSNGGGAAGGSSSGGGAAGGGSSGGGSAGGGSVGGGTAGGGSGGGQQDAGIDGGMSDAGICGTAKLCEQFESYTLGTLADNATLGPWHVSVGDSNGQVSIDGTHSVSGGKALKVHINSGSSSGGQLRTKAAPLFATPHAQLYGRFMMYLANGAGTSTHWTMFGAAGTVPPGTAAAGHHSTYLFSSFATAGKNSYGAVYYDDQTAQDCWHNSPELMPLDRWACVAFSVDGAAIKYRFWLDGQAVPAMNVDTTGDGCVSPTPGATPWYGPNFDEFYVGALSFHAMTASLDLWVDDVVLDTSPVACP